ncbi:MAG: type II toxin-antitoxin system HicB family antitoxin [Dehalococcoidia bacterium]
MQLTIETEQEDDGRWIAEVQEIPGAMVYADSREAALRNVQALALRVLSERIELGEAGPSGLIQLTFVAA